MKGYKYRGRDTFERDLESILNNQLYASSFDKLNDPFEATFKEEISQFGETLKMLGVDSSEVKHNFKEVLDYTSKLGIYSLSYTPINELMWAHYSSSHEGFCIEYDIEKIKWSEFENRFIKELDVDYKDAIPVLKWDDIYDLENVLKKMYATKSLSWQYEKEVRLLFDNYGLKSYHSSALTGIYFGAKMSDNLKQILINSLKNRDIKFYQISKGLNSYHIESRLVHENKRIIINKLDFDSFEILRTNHSIQIEVFDIWYKDNDISTDAILSFVKAFTENISTKKCIINIFNDKSIQHLLGKSPLTKEEYLQFADCYIADYNYVTPNVIYPYPYQDIRYKEYGGQNWKK
ncbi:hypothetical protein GCM10011514_15200 [Emticicia aquatilis]|uniref:DUF2971 domain-containing protein n=1 Tax=Emticicia aquatilis TaxID=1537369 RepID=A0A916YM74_9BACT|nr:DUF2971 domain-containing protein [Emticicia aquatilis]GGD51928.1 hypothetical protein GCM10011514_15200 [Emticicia aquatilis]